MPTRRAKLKKPVLICGETGALFGPLKDWTKQNLRREDWDFSRLADFPHEMLRVAWLFELDRELGSGNPPFLVVWEVRELEKRKAKLKAYLQSKNCLSDDYLSERDLLALLPEIPPDKSEDEARAALDKMLKPDMTPAESDAYREKGWALCVARRRRLDRIARAEIITKTTKWKPPIPTEPERILKSFQHHEFAKMQVPPYYTWVSGTASSHCTIHPLEIDWTLTESELLDAFRNWLRGGDHAPFHPSYKRMGRTSKVGKRKEAGWRARLRELAIYRISEAGFSRPQGLEKLGLKPTGKENKPAISAPNWEHAQARTRARILKEKERCEHSAWQQGGGSPKNWRDYFVKPFGL